jgi:hypothetical protein
LGLLVITGVGAAAALLLDSDKEDPTAKVSESEPAPISTTDPSDVVVPEGWSLYTSATGVMSYAVDPSWADLLVPEDQDFIQEFYSTVPDAKAEYSGAWLVRPSETGEEGVNLYVVSYSDGKAPGLARVLARGYIDFESYEDFEIVLDEEYTNGRGYSGWRIDYTGIYLGAPYSESVIALKTGTTVIYVFGTSDEDFEALMPDMLAVAHSIVVHHPPTGS